MSFFRNRSLVFKQCFWVLAGVIVIVGSIFYFMREEALSLLTSSLRNRAEQVGESTVRRLDQTFLECQRIAEMLSLRMEEGRLSDAELATIMQNSLKIANRSRPEVVALAVSFRPGAFGDNRQRMLLVRRQGDDSEVISGGNYLDKSWYITPMRTGRGLWCEPFVGDFIREPIGIYCIPFFEKTPDGKRKPAGVLCIDISLAWLNDVISDIKIDRSGYAFILSKTGRIVVHPDKSLVFKESFDSVAEKRNDPALKKIGQHIAGGEHGFSDYTSGNSGRHSWIVYLPLESNGWMLGVVFPANELFGLVDQLSGSLLWLGTGGLLILMGVVALISIRLTRPLQSLARAAGEIGKGDFTQQMPELESGDELGQLALAFRRMRDALVEHIAELKAVTSAKEKIESELKVAKEIQNSILPEILPPFPQSGKFEVDALLNPAREVGGDLYDFFLLDDNKVALVIGDVSGKGVPGSLFMAVTQTLHRGIAHSDITPGEIVGKLNRALCRNNNTMMFVTYLFAKLDLSRGKLRWSNAGHNPFYIRRADGSVERVTERHGVPLGIADEREYGFSEYELLPGDLIFFYTDGITEAMNAKGELFGDRRLAEFVKNCGESDPHRFNTELLRRLHLFCGDAPQYDDITILTLHMLQK
ncbi:MAG: SpoIIE family protein phosphatase [Victivallaceae bacterium]|nr:SpoIIE family protein phosphatase [Victivallaceae bacterium]